MSGGDWNTPTAELRTQIQQSLTTSGTEVLLTIVDVKGSAYRRPGAKMLFDADGVGTGSITAGCLETKLWDASQRVGETDQPEVVTYDLTADEDDVWGLGVGCDGAIEVLVEPVSEAYRPLADAFAERRDIGVITVLSDETKSAELADRAFFLPEKNGISTAKDTDATDWVCSTARSKAKSFTESGLSGTTTLSRDEGELRVFIDGIRALPEVVIFGAGRDAVPVAQFAAQNDFWVTVVGFRGGVEMSTRFSDANQTVTTSPRTVADEINLTEQTYTVVMTHNFVDDTLTMKQLLASSVPYIGLMGPQNRFNEMLEEFETSNTSVSKADLDRIYTPVGLDLGGGSPYQVAHSIIAELLAVSNNKTADHLRSRTGHIHERVDP